MVGPCHGGKGLFVTLDDDGKSVWVWGGGRGSGTFHLLHEDSALSGDPEGESLRLLAFIGTHVSIARFYAHDSLCMTYQVLAANATSMAELLKLTTYH